MSNKSFVRYACQRATFWSHLRFINAGWGRIPSKPYKKVNVKHYVTLLYVDLKVLFAQKLKEIDLLRKSSKFHVIDTHVCSGGEKGLDTCTGDGGGPLMLKENSHYTLVGIVSFGSNPCGIEGIPSAYTKVYHYLTWINSVIAEL